MRWRHNKSVTPLSAQRLIGNGKPSPFEKETNMSSLALLGGNPVINDAVQAKLSPLSSGPGQAFVEKLREYTGAAYARCFSWGTWAITASLVAAEVGPGDEVICPSFTWAASVNPILHVNGIPIFAEVDPKTYTIDPTDVEKKITPHTKAIIAVDYYGHPADIPALKKLARQHDLVLIEDACQASGADIDGVKVGNLSDMTCFSFAGKPISSTSGGAWTTNDHHYYERALCAGEHSSFLCQLDDKQLRDRFTPTLGYGFKNRIDPSAAEIALKQLETLDERNDGRINNCNFLTEAFSSMDGLTPPYVRPGYKHVYHFYTVLFDEDHFDIPRALFCDALTAEGLFITNTTSSGNSRLFAGGGDLNIGAIHQRPIFRDRNLYGKGCPFLCPLAENHPEYNALSLPVTERLTRQEINFHQRMTMPPKNSADMQTYIDVFAKIIDNLDQLHSIKESYKKEYMVDICE
jgi:dTDP-4-amino-4,6-dideoxygalactose transaminase